MNRLSTITCQDTRIFGIAECSEAVYSPKPFKQRPGYPGLRSQTPLLELWKCQWHFHMCRTVAQSAIAPASVEVYSLPLSWFSSGAPFDRLR
jgi:hypothetical protein